MSDNKNNLFHSGFDVYTNKSEDTETMLFTDEFSNVDLIVKLHKNGQVTIMPKNSNAKIEILDNEVIITSKK